MLSPSLVAILFGIVIGVVAVIVKRRSIGLGSRSAEPRARGSLELHPGFKVAVEYPPDERLEQIISAWERRLQKEFERGAATLRRNYTGHEVHGSIWTTMRRPTLVFFDSETADLVIERFAWQNKSDGHSVVLHVVGGVYSGEEIDGSTSELKLLPQAADVGIDHPAGHHAIVVPNQLEQAAWFGESLERALLALLKDPAK